MAEIKNGFLISTKSKVAGTVLYRANGKQLMRGVPVYPKEYVGSDSQIKARDFFAEMSSLVASYSAQLSIFNAFQLSKGRRYKGTYRDQLLGRMVGNFYVKPDGTPRNYTELNSLREAINKQPGLWLLRNMRIPAFPQHMPMNAKAYVSAFKDGNVELVVNTQNSEIISVLESMRMRGWPRVSTKRIGYILIGTIVWQNGGNNMSELGLVSGNSLDSAKQSIGFETNGQASDFELGENAGIIYFATMDVNRSGSDPLISIPLFSLYTEGTRLFY